MRDREHDSTEPEQATQREEGKVELETNLSTEMAMRMLPDRK